MSWGELTGINIGGIGRFLLFLTSAFFVIAPIICLSSFKFIILSNFNNELRKIQLKPRRNRLHRRKSKGNGVGVFVPDLAATDIIENTLRRHDGLLELLLIDRTKTTNKKAHNILWATDSYSSHKADSEILIADITGSNTYLIQPRIAKSKEEQKSRTKDKAEVFTPREIVSRMNQQADWTGGHWPVDDDNWQDYVSEYWLSYRPRFPPNR